MVLMICGRAWSDIRWTPPLALLEKCRGEMEVNATRNATTAGPPPLALPLPHSASSKLLADLLPRATALDSRDASIFHEEWFTIANRTLYLHEGEHVQLGHHTTSTANSVWDCSIILAKFLEANQSRLPLRGHRVIELTYKAIDEIRHRLYHQAAHMGDYRGAGKGLVSLAAHSLGGDVLATDTQEVIENVTVKSIALNLVLEACEASGEEGRFEMDPGSRESAQRVCDAHASGSDQGSLILLSPIDSQEQVAPGRVRIAALDWRIRQVHASPKIKMSAVRSGE